MTPKNSVHRIVLIHATPVSIDPIQAAFSEEWPEAETVNLLDDALGRDLDTGICAPELIEKRIGMLGAYGLTIGADGILFSCSAFGRAIDAAKKAMQIPVLKPNEAMFEEAIWVGGKIGMIATFKPSIASMEEEFHLLAKDLNKTVRLDSMFVDGAMAELAQGDISAHNRLIQEASATFADYDAVMLAQFSASHAVQEVENQLGCVVLTSPSSAVRKLKSMLRDQ